MHCLHGLHAKIKIQSRQCSLIHEQIMLLMNQLMNRFSSHKIWMRQIIYYLLDMPEWLVNNIWLFDFVQFNWKYLNIKYHSIYLFNDCRFYCINLISYGGKNLFKLLMLLMHPPCPRPTWLILHKHESGQQHTAWCNL